MRERRSGVMVHHWRLRNAPALQMASHVRMVPVDTRTRNHRSAVAVRRSEHRCLPAPCKGRTHCVARGMVPSEKRLPLELRKEAVLNRMTVPRRTLGAHLMRQGSDGRSTAPIAGRSGDTESFVLEIFADDGHAVK